MTLLNEIMFTRIPMFALVANIFLFFTMLSARKDSSIKAFMGLLFSFILWSGGALMMRSQIYPGTGFWWTVSISGIFLVPYMYYLLFSAYTEQKGVFLKICFGAATVLMVVLNAFNVFMTKASIVNSDGRVTSDFTVKWPAVFPVILTFVIFFFIGRMIIRTLLREDMPVSYLMPIFAGIAAMLAGIGLNVAFPSLPADTLGCAVNACFIYYAFYKKRFYALSQIASKGSMYIISIVITAIVISSFYKSIDMISQKFVSHGGINMTLIITVSCSAVAIILFMGLNRLNEGVFIREQVRREDRVRDFSSRVSSTLKTDEILQLFSDLVKEEIGANHMYICMYDAESDTYTTNNKIASLEKHISLRSDHPVIKKLEQTGGGFMHSDFCKTAAYKSMWEREKRQLAEIGAAYFLPFNVDENSLGFVILSEKKTGKPYGYAEIKFLESVASVASIALKNSVLYHELEREALMDPLTGLYNRRTFNRKMEELFSGRVSLATLVLLNLDDFSLYNELYGSEEGDRMLRDFSRMIERTFGTGNIIARYSGKEFAVLMPHCDTYSAIEKTDRLRALLAENIELSRERIKKFLTFSAGICSYPSSASSGSQMLSYANMAVFQVKHQGKNSTKVYDSREPRDSSEKNSGANELTSTIFALTAAIDAKDHYTFNHSRCVSKYASELGEIAGLEQDLVAVIRQAGLLHDIGKIGIPDVILTKTGKLTPEEFAIMRQHVERSIQMIRHLPTLDYIIPAVLCHHERFDGRGYPRGIRGEDIPVTARCLSIADSFDAMVSKRSYKNKMPVSQALEEIEKNLGLQFDPVLGRLFIDSVKNGSIEVVEY